MSGNLSISPADEAGIFECPNCKQTINTSMSKCPFCSVALDPHEASVAADLMDQVNQACSDASYLRIMAGTMWGFWVLSLIPFVGVVGTLGMWFLLIAIPAMAIRWRVKFGAVWSDDPEFSRAKRVTVTAVGIWALFVLFLVVVSALSRASH
jgi:hypothetical protein